jgi:hypothetical protein
MWQCFEQSISVQLSVQIPDQVWMQFNNHNSFRLISYWKRLAMDTIGAEVYPLNVSLEFINQAGLLNDI